VSVISFLRRIYRKSQKIVALLHEQTLDRLAAAVQSGKYRIRDLPMAMMDEMSQVAG